MKALKNLFRKKKDFAAVGLLLLLSITVSAGHQFFHLLAQTYPVLSITPTAVTIGNGLQWKFSPVGGVPPYSYTLIGAGGALDSTTGVYTADSVGGYTVTVRVTDGSFQTADGSVTVTPAPVVTCGTSYWTNSLNGRIYDPGGASGNYADWDYCDYEIDLGARIPLSFHFNSFSTEAVNDTFDLYDWNWNRVNFSGSTVPADQVTPNGYYYFEFGANGSINSSGFDISWSATNPAQPHLIASQTNIHASYTSSLSVVGGVGPYTFSIVSGGGSLSNVTDRTALYNAPLTATSAVVRVTDALNQVSDVTINVTKNALTISGVSGDSGSPSGGYTLVSYSVTGLMLGATVTVGGANCPMTATQSTYFYCTVPAGSAGKVDIVLTNPDGATATLIKGFEYQQGTWTTMPSPSTASRSYYGSVWTGDRWVLWAGQDPTCSYAACTKSDGFVYDPTTDSWSAMSPSPLGPRVDMAQVWTGQEVLFYGGRDGGNVPNDGAKYNPYTDSWTTISSPFWQPRQNPSQVWTGQEMILWGGQYDDVRNEGIAYNPATDSWRSIASGPSSRYHHQAVWTGNRMFVYGGASNLAFSTFPSEGLVYNPETDTWLTTATPILRGKSSDSWSASEVTSNFMVWTGDKVFLSGGGSRGTGSRYDAFYDPKTNAWSYSTTDLPTGSGQSAMVWTGDLIVRVLNYPNSTNGSVKALNPKTQEISSFMPSLKPQQTRSLIWTGSEVLTCFGYWGTASGSDCERLDLGNLRNRLVSMSRDSWISIGGANAPSARNGASSVWTGAYFIVWGGMDGSTYLNTGYKYDPFNDVWTPLNSTGAPSGRSQHTAIWSGSKMIVWGGQTAAGVQTNTGAFYDPATDTWSDISVTGAVPSAREGHTATWTGLKMLVWGGRNSGGTLSDGSILDVSTNSWTAISSTGAPPTARARHRSLWTGSQMIIWGGDEGATFTNTGSMYNLNTDSWTALSVTSAPSARADFSMVLGQNKLIVWGGTDSAGTALASGGVYDLSSNAWSMTNSAGAPSARSQASTVFTGRSMVIWGGVDGSTTFADGYLYDSRSDQWRSVPSSGLSSRYGAVAGWTGSVGDGRASGSNAFRNNSNGDTGRLIIWGGFDGTSYKNDGKIYNLPLQ